MDNNKQIQVLRCIEYPGLVQNTNNMLKTLGGINKISGVFTTDKQRLELKFHPNNVYNKPTLSDQVQSTGMLLKFKFLKAKKPKCDRSMEPERQLQSISFVGLIDTIYKFESLCDFQYLPLIKSPDTKNTQFVYHECIPPELVTIDWITEAKNTPYFLPPVLFSRMDSVNLSLFKKEMTKDTDKNVDDDDLITPKKLPSHKHATYLQFNLTGDIPDKPSVYAIETLKVKFVSNDEYNLVKALFEKRPLWTKTAIAYETKISLDKLKYILPSVSYYYTTGPWRVMWVRYGYDTRKDFESRYYQCLDYRIRAFNGLKTFVDIKRNKLNVSTKSTKTTSAFHSIDTLKKDTIYYSPYFEVDYLPKSRQCFFQYCDIHVPKIQEMLDKVPSPLSGSICNEKTGWLPIGFDDQCREILNIIVRENIAVKRGESFIEEFNSDDESEEDIDEDYEQMDDLDME